LTDGISEFDFRLGGEMGYILGAQKDQHGLKGIKKQHRKYNTSRDSTNDLQVIKVKCYPLHMIASALGRRTIDYWSLDVEGAEVGVLNSTKFDMIEVGVMTIEVQYNRRVIRAIMTKNGFERVRTDGRDDFFASRTYFQRRGLPFPRH